MSPKMRKTTEKTYFFQEMQFQRQFFNPSSPGKIEKHNFRDSNNSGNFKVYSYLFRDIVTCTAGHREQNC